MKKKEQNFTIFSIKRGRIIMNTKDFEIKIVKAEELKKLCMNNEVEEREPLKFLKGFRYVCKADYEEDERKDFIVAISDNIVVGVLKLGTIHEKKYKYKYISFVDVKEEYKNRGIARLLYQHIEKTLDNDKKVVSSFLTSQGKIAKLDKLLKQYVTSVPTSIQRR